MTRDAKSSATSGDQDLEMVWIYTCGNFAEIEIITDVFDDEDIAYILRKMEPPGFTVGVSDHDQTRIAVQEDRAVEARQLIQQATVDEAIPGDGNFIEHEDKRPPGSDK